MATLPKYNLKIGSESTCGTDSADLPSLQDFSKLYLGFDPASYKYQAEIFQAVHDNKGGRIVFSTPRQVGVHSFWSKILDPNFQFKLELANMSTKELLIMRLTADLDKQIYIKEELSKRDLKSIARNQKL